MFIKGTKTIATTPSETIKDLMEVHGMSRDKLGKMLSMTESEINQLLDDYYPMNDSLAVLLKETFGPAATFWKNLEKNFLEDKKKVDAELQTLGFEPETKE